jgi:AcrR family transcriptional regulator
VKTGRQGGGRAARAKVRRAPRQARSQERLERILQAAARTFDAVGFEAATMSDIAGAAGTSLASLYRFFADKRALADTLLSRYAGEARQLFEQITRIDPRRPALETFLSQVVDAFAVFYRQHPGFRGLRIGSYLSLEQPAAWVEMQAQFERRAARVIALRAAHLGAREQELLATVVLSVLDALALRVHQVRSELAPGLLAETKALLLRYLRPLEAGGHLEGPAESSDPAINGARRRRSPRR